MASSTLLYIAWPVTLGLSFMAGSMVLSKESTTEHPKNGNPSKKISHRNPSSNGSTNENPTAPNRRSSAAISRAGMDGNAESYDIKEIANTNDPLERMAKLLRMIPQLGPGDFEQVIADFRELNITTKRLPEYKTLLTAWAKINPEGALTYAKKNTSTSLATSTILGTWAEYAPDAAVQWVKLNHEGDKANPYLLAIIKGMTISNPAGATEILQDLPSNLESYQPLKDIVKQVSKLGVEKSISWLATIKDEKHLANATHTLVYPLAKKDPQATIDWLKTLPENMLNNNVGVVARAWAAQDLDKAVEWTGSLEGKARTLAASQVIGQFISSDPNKAATWMKTMSGEPGYERIVNSFIVLAEDDHPELALTQLDQLADKGSGYFKETTLVKWATKDKGAATQWMQDNNMDAAAQQEILSAPASGFVPPNLSRRGGFKPSVGHFIQISQGLFGIGGRQLRH